MNTPGLLPKGLIGHVYDLFLITAFKFRNPHSYTKYRLIKSVQKNQRATAFIEIGTYKGITAKRCSRIFDHVYTIELDEQLYNYASDYLKNHSNVHLFQGDAKIQLPTLLGEIPSDMIVFLDGHFSGSDTALGDEPEPALSLIHELGRHKDKVKAIIIDDFREFGYRDWPAKSELLNTLEREFLQYQYDLFIHLDMVIVQQT